MNSLIVGFGSIGRRHHQNLKHLGVSTVDVFDPSVQNPPSDVKVFSDSKDLAKQYDSIFVCSPNSMHLQSLKEFADRSKFFFIEKPISLQPVERKEYQRLVDQHGLKLMVGCNYRFEEGLNTVKNWIAENKPEIFYVDCEYGHYLPQWRLSPYQQSYSAQKKLGGGIAFDRIHEFDYLHWLLGEFKIVASSIHRVSDLEIDTEDSVDALLSFASGAQGRLHLDYLQRKYNCRLRLITSLGDIEWTFMPCSVNLQESKDHSVVLYEGQNDVNEMYVKQTRYFLDCVAQNKMPVNDVNEAFNLVALIAEMKRQHEF